MESMFCYEGWTFWGSNIVGLADGEKGVENPDKYKSIVIHHSFWDKSERKFWFPTKTQVSAKEVKPATKLSKKHGQKKLSRLLI